MTTTFVASAGAAATSVPSAGSTADSCSVPFPPARADGVESDNNGRQYPQPTNSLHQSQPQFSASFSSLTSSPPAVDRQPATDHNGDPAITILTFAEIPTNLTRLDFDHRPNDTRPGSNNAIPPPILSSTTPSKQTPLITQTHTPSPSPSPSRFSLHSGVGHDSIGRSPATANTDRADPNRLIPSPASSSSSTPIHNPQPRKPSPGLAARLKALGFGTVASKPPPLALPPQPEHIGRLPEDQLRQLDQKHQAGSVVPVIERRGRPWKGAGAAVARFASGRNSKSNADTDRDVYPSDEDSASILLPEIEAAPPLEMDTNKYRLPDHTNGNGTKVQLDTRQQHLERDVRPADSDAPPSPDASPEIPPPPLPKDTPPLPPSSTSSFSVPAPSTPSQNDFSSDVTSYFNPLGLQRTGSIYTLSRVSFANQLAQLTSLQLPDAESLSSRVSAIPTAQAATRALIGAAEQIRNWVAKASEVIDGLDSDDDVEWAAAGGREGLEEVEHAIFRFEELINVYVSAIEELQSRPDISNVDAEDLHRAVVQMESILDEWQKMRTILQSVKGQVEIAMEWEELWSMVLGDIQNEMEELSRLVFEMEERRHKSILADGATVDDIGDLETIVEETQQQQKQQPPNNAATRLPASSGSNRYSIPVFPVSPSSPDAGSVTPSISQDDSSLLALFARMQPLRASLDFLPMRLSVFEARASSCFPTACEELEMRRSGLDGSYKKLEKDAESLRKELGEDRWVAVFRGAARQAQKMYESVERSVAKLREALDAGLHLTNQPLMAKKTESYETKKAHYGPAIERVLAIIDKGIKDRLTLNGEILRLHAELQTKWDDLRDRMHDVDMGLEDVHAEYTSQQLRDSISSMLSNDRSTIGSGHETPQSSPPSSVIMSSLGLDNGSQSAGANGKTDNKGTPTNMKRRSVMGGSHLPQPANRRSVSSSAAAVAQARKPLRFSNYMPPGSISGLSTPNREGREGSVTPVGKRSLSRPPRPTPPSDSRPRWNSSTNGVDTGHNFRPLSLTTPSPYAKTPPVRRTSSMANTPGSGTGSTTKLPTRSPLGRGATASPVPSGSPSRGTPGSSGIPYRPRLNSHSSIAGGNSRRASIQPSWGPEMVSNGSPRPASSMSASRRNSLLPSVRVTRDGSSIFGGVSGRNSPQAVAGARVAMMNGVAGEQNRPERPRWRP